MGKEMKRRVLIGIGGFLGSVLIGAAFLWIGLESLWLRYLLFAVILPSSLGFLMYIFGGWRRFILGAYVGLGLVGLLVLGRLPSWGFGLVILAAVFVFAVRPLVKRYRKNRKMDKDAVKSAKMQTSIFVNGAGEAALQMDEAGVKSAISFGTKSLLVISETGCIHQLIRGADRLFVALVGDETGLNMELLRTDFSDETAFLKDTNDFDIPDHNITSIQFRFGQRARLNVDNCGKLTIQTNQKRFVFTVAEALLQEQLEAFFRGLPFVMTGMHYSVIDPEQKLTRKENEQRPTLRGVVLVLTIAALVAGAALIFLSIDLMLSRILLAICIIIPLITLGLYVKYDNLLSADGTDDEVRTKNSRIDITIPLAVSTLALVMRDTIFNITGWAKLIIWSVAVLAVMLLMFFRFTKEYKRRKGVIGLIVLIALFFAPLAVLHLNVFFDNTKPTVYPSELLDKGFADGRSKAFYYTVTMDDGNQMVLEVPSSIYKMSDVGDTVTVVESDGLLGIGYVYIEEE